MRFEAQEDIAAPLAHVFAQASDFALFERRVLHEGARLTRRPDGPISLGTIWDVTAIFRGKKRDFIATLTEIRSDDGYLISVASEGLTGRLRVGTVALSAQRTRVLVRVDVAAQGLSGQIVLQGMRLAKARLTAQFHARIHGYAARIAASHAVAR